MGALTIAAFTSPPWPSPSNLVEYVSGHAYTRADQTYSALVERGWAVYGTNHNQTAPARWSADRKNLITQKSAIRAMVGTGLWVVAPTVDCAGAYTVLAESNLYSMAGINTNWFDVTPYAGLATDSNGWRFMRNVLTCMVYTVAGPPLVEYAHYVGCGSFTNDNIDGSQCVVFSLYNVATNTGQPAWLGQLTYSGPGPDSEGNPLAAIGEYTKTRFRGAVSFSTTSVPPPLVRSWSRIGWIAGTTNWGCLEYSPGMFDAPNAPLYGFVDNTNACSTNVLDVWVERTGAETQNVGFVTATAWDERFWVDVTGCQYAENGCGKQSASADFDFEGVDCPDGSDYNTGPQLFDIDHSEAVGLPQPVVTFADWSGSFSYP